MALSGEFDLIDLIRQKTRIRCPGVDLGIGDDAAAIQPTPGMRLLLTTDAMVEGVHFVSSPPWRLGRRPWR